MLTNAFSSHANMVASVVIWMGPISVTAPRGGWDRTVSLVGFSFSYHNEEMLIIL